jgi:cystathionine beta-lyase/cystathionine gamma-synthase
MTEHRRPATTAVQAGRPPRLAGQPVVTPVHREVIYEFESAAQFAEVMADSRRGYLYSRIRNPNTDELANVVAELEGAQTAHCFASGMAAITAALDLLAPPGTRVVAARQLYGQTYAVLRARGDTALVDVADADGFQRALSGAAVLYLEALSNPHLTVPDLPRLAALARSAGARVVVDNTIATPFGCNPLAMGADLTLHSATKFLNGHADALAGVVAGPAELIGPLAHRSLDTGSTLSPDVAWLVRRGIKTLHLRLERSTANAARVADFLAGHRRVAGVRYPGLRSDPFHDVAARVLTGFGGLVTFEVEGGRASGERVMDRCRVALRATSLGGVETTISHPASTSHRQLSAEELEAAGISEGFLRLSVGVEDAEDLIADLEQALA